MPPEYLRSLPSTSTAAPAEVTLVPSIFRSFQERSIE